MPAAIARGQRYLGLEPFEFDPGARTGAQQPVGRLLEAKPALLGIGAQHRVERGKESGDVAVDAAAQFLVERGAAVLAHRSLVARHLRRHLTGRPGFAHRAEVAAARAIVERVAWRRLEWRSWLRLLLRPVTGIVAVAMTVAVAKAEMQLRTLPLAIALRRWAGHRHRRCPLDVIAMLRRLDRWRRGSDRSSRRNLCFY